MLEAHPTDPHILLSAGHDGYVILWDLRIGGKIQSFHNSVSHQLSFVFYFNRMNTLLRRFYHRFILPILSTVFKFVAYLINMLFKKITLFRWAAVLHTNS